MKRITFLSLPLGFFLSPAVETDNDKFDKLQVLLWKRLLKGYPEKEILETIEKMPPLASIEINRGPSETYNELDTALVRAGCTIKVTGIESNRIFYIIAIPEKLKDIFNKRQKEYLQKYQEKGVKI